MNGENALQSNNVVNVDWDAELKVLEDEVRAVVSENPFNPQVSLKTVNVEEQFHESLRQIDGSKELLWLLSLEPERTEENLLHIVEGLLIGNALRSAIF